jgi:hypothetical protein
MNRKMKFKVLVSIIVMLAVLGLPAFTLADDTTDRPSAPTVGYPAGYSAQGNNLSIGIMSMQYLSLWQAMIAINSGNSIQISGFTNTFTAVDRISLDLYLQYWDESNGIWQDAKYAGEWFSMNSSSVTGSKGYTVSSKFYYRTKTIHYAVDSGSNEAITHYSGYIYIP